MQFTAKTVEDATAQGLEALGITAEQADIVVLEEPTKGLFGRLKGKAVVDVVKKQSNLDKTVEFVQQILDLMGIEATAEIKEDGENACINLVAKDGSAVIGHRGEVLDAIQTLAGATANIGNKVYKKVVVDCESYRGRREETLIKLAHKLEDKAADMRREVILEPMPPFERRIIHMALADSEKVTTKSDGKEPNRYVVIVPNDKDEFSKPYNAGRNGSDGRRGRRDGKDSRGGRGNRRDGKRSGRSDARRSSAPIGEKRKPSSMFGTYLGNSLKNN